jgi:hypothetical protein
MRRTYHYDEKLKKLVEGPGPHRGEGSGDNWRFSDRAYSSEPFKTPDGTVIDSRKKHRDYMKRTGLTTIDDFTQTWATAEKKRAEYFAGKDPTRREDIVRTIHKRRT